MLKKILIIHDEGVLLKVIKNSINKEFLDLHIDTVLAVDELGYLLTENKYDFILCKGELDDVKIYDIKKFIDDTEKNSKTPFVVMTSCYSEKTRNELIEIGVEHILPLPFDSYLLRSLISKVTNQSSLRQHERFIIPGTDGIININNSEIMASILDISAGGVFCAIEYSTMSFDINLMNTCGFYILFPEDYNNIAIKGIKATPVRVIVKSYYSDNSPKLVEIAYKFFDVSFKEQKTLEIVLAAAKKDQGELEEGYCIE